jgi:hypothetical protein
MIQRTSVLPRVSQFGEPFRYAGTHCSHFRLSQSASAGAVKRRRPSERSFYRRGGRNFGKKNMPSLSRSAAWCPSRGSWQKLGGFDADASDWQERRWREKGEQPRRIHRPGDRILFIFCLACHSNSQPFQNRSPSKPADRVAVPPLRATPVCQNFSSPSKGRRGLVATLPSRCWPRANLSLKIFIVHLRTCAHTHAVRYPVPD